MPLVATMLVATVLAATLVSGCGATTTIGPPKPTPMDIVGIADELAARGVIVTNVISGDAGCDDPDMIGAAIGFDAAGLDQPTPTRVRLYIFRNRAAYEKQRQAVDACAASWVTDPATFEAIDVSPYVAAGQGPWGAQLRAAIRAALTAAAGTGG
jgi:hypothetical protein